MILAHYDLWIPLEKLRQECGVNRDGSKASCVLRAAKNRNCKANGYKLKVDELLELVPDNPFPMIIHWEFNHFVVLEGIKNGIAYLNDPAMGRRTVPIDEFRTSYTGVALMIEPGEGFKKEGHRYNVFKEIAAKLKKDKWAVSAMVGIVGSGGFVKYEDGIPMFNALVMGSIFKSSLQNYAQNADPIITPDMYTIDSEVKGKQYIYGATPPFRARIGGGNNCIVSDWC